MQNAESWTSRSDNMYKVSTHTHIYTKEHTHADERTHGQAHCDISPLNAQLSLSRFHLSLTSKLEVPCPLSSEHKSSQLRYPALSLDRFDNNQTSPTGRSFVRKLTDNVRWRGKWNHADSTSRHYPKNTAAHNYTIVLTLNTEVEERHCALLNS